MASQEKDWTVPRAMAIPKEGYFKSEQGTHGPTCLSANARLLRLLGRREGQAGTRGRAP